MKVRIFTLLAAIIAISFLFTSCKDDAVSSSSNNEVQQYKDKSVAAGFVNTFWFIWNQNLAGQPAGNKDLTVNGPLGGTIHITGTTEKNGDINTIHLIYDMSDCKNSGAGYSLTFTGAINCNGTFSDSHRAMNYVCSTLSYTGTVGSSTVYNINENCSISFAESTSQLSGTICNREFVHDWK